MPGMPGSDARARSGARTHIRARARARRFNPPLLALSQLKRVFLKNMGIMGIMGKVPKTLDNFCAHVLGIMGIMGNLLKANEKAFVLTTKNGLPGFHTHNTFQSKKCENYIARRCRMACPPSLPGTAHCPSREKTSGWLYSDSSMLGRTFVPAAPVSASGEAARRLPRRRMDRHQHLARRCRADIPIGSPAGCGHSGGPKPHPRSLEPLRRRSEALRWAAATSLNDSKNLGISPYTSSMQQTTRFQ